MQPLLCVHVYICVCICVCVCVLFTSPCRILRCQTFQVKNVNYVYTTSARRHGALAFDQQSGVHMGPHKHTRKHTHKHTHTKPDTCNPSSSHLALQRRESLPLGTRRLWPRSVAQRRARCTRVCDFAPLRQQQEQRQSGSTLHQFSSFSCSKFHLSKQKKNGRSGCSSYAGCNLRVP